MDNFLRVSAIGLLAIWNMIDSPPTADTLSNTLVRYVTLGHK